jgi:RNA polymerase sigma factor (sigma-70 family)
VTPTQQPHSNPWRDDLALVRSVLAGDRLALERFIYRMDCVPAILSHCNARRRGSLSDEDLADLAQEVLTSVWERLPGYLGQGALESWVYPFCTQMFQNSVRSKRRRPLHSDIDAAAHLSDPHPALGDLLATSDLIHRHLERLEAIQASVIRARHFEALSFEEIARRLDVPLTTAKTHYRRGLDLLRSYLGPHLKHDPV